MCISVVAESTQVLAEVVLFRERVNEVVLTASCQDVLREQCREAVSLDSC